MDRFLKPILIILATSIIYYTLIRPARLIVNQKIYYPLISTIFSDYKVSLPSNNTAAIIMSHNNLNDQLWVVLPFGGFYIFPAVLLTFKRNWNLVKKLTYYHLILSLIPLLLLISIFNKIVNSIPFDLFQQLTIVLGLVFTIIAGREYLNKYE